MKLNLKKPLVIFDLESTGLDLVNDRIIQISYVKVSPNGDEERKNIFVNPGKPIPHEVQELTGITDDNVKDAPTFKQLAKQLADSFSGCDFAGYNSNRFDIPLLAEEFLRAGIDFDFSRCHLIDAQSIFFKTKTRKPPTECCKVNWTCIILRKRKIRSAHYPTTWTLWLSSLP